MEGLITDDNETAYSEEVRDLAVWCQDNILSLNVDYMRHRAEHSPIHSVRP